MSKSKKVTLKLEPTGAAALHGIIAAEQKTLYNRS